MDHVPIADERAASDLQAGEAEVEPFADRRADGCPIERRDCPADHPPERARVRVVVGVRLHHPRCDGALVVEVRRHGGLDEAWPTCRQCPWVVEHLERDQAAPDADGQPGRPVRTRERRRERTRVVLLGSPQLVERRGPGASTIPGFAAADLRPDLALVGREGVRYWCAGSRELLDAPTLLADLGAHHPAEVVVGLAAGPEAHGVTRVPASVFQAGDRQLGDLPGGQPDRDVDDPVLLTADDGVAGEDDDRLVLRGRRYRRDGPGADLLDLHRAGGGGLLEEEVGRGGVRHALGAGGDRAGGNRPERREHEAVALHGHAAPEACEGLAQCVAGGLRRAGGGEGASR